MHLFQVTIVKLCGKKTPLVHHRRHRRRKTLHHVNNTELDPNLEGPDSIHVHPTAVKSDIAKHKRKEKKDKEARKHKSRERGNTHPEVKSVSKDSSSTDRKKYQFAQSLANDLSSRLKICSGFFQNGKFDQIRLRIYLFINRNIPNYPVTNSSPG